MKHNFEAKHIKKSIEALDKHLRVAEQYAATNQGYKKGILKKLSLWGKVFGVLKS